jgi:hypothetical protein
MLDSTSWIQIDRVRKLFPPVHAVQIPFFAQHRDRAREATVAALAHALDMHPRQLVQRLVADELKRLENG